MDVADVVEDFSLPDQQGVTRRLSDLVSNGPVALFFYPAAMTLGCTAECRHFRDLGREFAELGAGRVGISADAVDKQRQFSGLHDFDYPLLSDSDGTVAKIFGTRRRFGPLRTKRWTFVIGTDRKVIGVVKSEVRMEQHADQALKILRERATS